MRPGLRHRRRVRLAWLTLFALLLQQFALAAHACERGFEPPAAADSAADGGSHREHCRSAPTPSDADAGLLCDRHCSPDELIAASDGAGPAVAPALLPPCSMPPASDQCPQAIVPGAPDAAVDPPPMLRFCTLLI